MRQSSNSHSRYLGATRHSFSGTCHPASGDARFRCCRTLALDGGLIVTTPQDGVALEVALRGIQSFEKVTSRFSCRRRHDLLRLPAWPRSRRRSLHARPAATGSRALESPSRDSALYTPIFAFAATRGVPVVIAAPYSDTVQSLPRGVQEAVVKQLGATSALQSRSRALNLSL